MNSLATSIKTLTNNNLTILHCSEGSLKPTFTRINPDTKFLDDEDVEGVHLLNDFDLVREMQVRLGEFAKGPRNIFPAMWPVSLST
jgi:hypothetical protein